MSIKYPRHRVPLARKLRRQLTDAERCLWQRLRRSQLGWRFQRQRPLGPYVVDFYCAAAGLVVEVDGSQHLDPDGLARDHERDGWLKSQGLAVLRFDNRQVLLETDAVLEEIRYNCLARAGEGNL